MSGGAIQGLRVLELGNMIAAPTAGEHLADFGATVVKVEHPVHGDDLRHWPPVKDGVPLWWKVTNRNKRLLTLDLGKPAGQALLQRMVPDFDVLIENFRPGTMERWGLGYEALAEQNPGLIMVRISGYGQTGPYARRPGYGTIAEAMSGVPSMTGFADRPPTLSAFPLVDVLAGLSAVSGTLMAVYERDVAGSGRGQVVDVSLYESIFRLVDAQVIAHDQLGLVKQRNGNRMAEDSPRNIYATSDGGWIAISAGSQRTFNRLATAIGRPELTEDPRFCDNGRRVTNADALDQIMADWFAAMPSAEALDILERHDVVAGAVYTVEDIVADPHYQARENIVSVPDDDLGSVRMQGVTPVMSRTPGSVRWPGGRRGEFNEEYFRGTLGVDGDEYDSLVETRTI